MMRTREQLRKAVQEAHTLEDKNERAFKLFVIDIELQLDLRDLLVPIAEDAKRRNIEASGKLEPRK